MAKARKPQAKVRRTLGFTASVASVIEIPEGDVVTIQLAERRNGGPRITLSRAFEPGNPEQYTLHDQRGASCEGGISRWSLARGTLELRLTPAATKKLGFHGFTIAIGDKHVERVREALARVLAKKR